MRHTNLGTLSTLPRFQSTHPTRECDKSLIRQTLTITYFNPRTLQESATTVMIGIPKTRLISIHAPYKRVRLATCLATSLSLSYFNPRTLQESATDQFGIAWHISIFQSTHPTRECDDDEYVGFYKSKEWHFNPRTLQESATLIKAQARSKYLISIHAPYKRVRQAGSYHERLRQCISIHAPYKRVRQCFIFN